MAGPSRSPFDDMRALVASLPGPDEAAAAAARARVARVAPGGLGRFGALVAFLAGWQGKAAPSADRGAVCVFAATHGVAPRLGCADAASLARHRLDAFAAGTTPTNAACAAGGLGFKAFDLALDVPSGDIRLEPAMSERDCVATMAFGMEAVAGGSDVLALGHASVASEVSAAAILWALSGDPPGRVGTGSREALDAVTEAVLRHGPEAADPLAVLASLGGRDIAALAGAIVAARSERVPVVLDGVAATAAAAILHALDPRAIGHCLVAQVGPAPGQPALLARLGLEPLLAGFDLPDGDGLAGATALGLVKTALAASREPKAAGRP